jgi:hypothetical protein
MLDAHEAGSVHFNVMRLRETTMSRRVLALACFTLVVACESAEPDSSANRVRVEARLAASIGADESAGEDYLFGAVSSVAADRYGRIYVADMLASRVQVYDSAGVFLQTIGREGDGPGEFRVPFGIILVENKLWVRERLRVSQFLPRTPGSIPDSPAQVRQFSASSALKRARMVDSRYYSPGYFYPLEGGFHFFYLVVADAGVVDTVPSLPNLDRVRGTTLRGRRLDAEQRRLISTLALAPFEPTAVWDLTNRGTVIGGSGASPEIHEFDAAGNVIRTIELPWEPRAISDAERADSTAALRARLEALEVPLDQIEGVSPAIQSGTLPDHVPQYTALFVGSDDRIWVRLWPAAGELERTDFAVLDTAGTFEAFVTIPVDLSTDIPPFFGDSVIIGVHTDPRTGVQSVVSAVLNGP